MTSSKSNGLGATALAAALLLAAIGGSTAQAPSLDIPFAPTVDTIAHGPGQSDQGVPRRSRQGRA